MLGVSQARFRLTWGFPGSLQARFMHAWGYQIPFGLPWTHLMLDSRSSAYFSQDLFSLVRCVSLHVRFSFPFGSESVCCGLL
jgi:hypothetical protein